jgi:Tfp pilus assembly protein PilN
LININLLPMDLQRVREPGYWRLLSVLFPLLAFGIIFAFQFTANQTVTNIEAENQQLGDRLALLQPALAEQQELQRRQAQLRDLIAVATAVREGQVAWSRELTGMLEYLPSQTFQGRPGIDFRTLQMQSIHPPRQDPGRYEGAPVIGELSVAGTVAGVRVLEQFIRSLEDSPSYGVAFQSASRNQDEDSELYDYNLVIGALGSEVQ